SRSVVAKPSARLPLLPPTACRGCGLILAQRRRTWCDGCLPEAMARQARERAAAGVAAQARMRAGGRDPSHGAAARARHSATAARRRAEERAWQGPTADPEEFRREILPRLRHVPLLKIAAAT